MCFVLVFTSLEVGDTKSRVSKYSLLFSTLAQLVRAAVTVSGCESHGFESHMCYLPARNRVFNDY